MGPRGETGRTEEQSKGCSQGWGSDKQSSSSSSAASSSRAHLEPGEESGVPAREAGPGRSSPQRCSLGLPSPTSQRTGEAFSQRGLRPPGRLLKAALLSLRLRQGDAAKGAFCSRFSMGHPQGACELEET